MDKLYFVNQLGVTIHVEIVMVGYRYIFVVHKYGHPDITDKLEDGNFIEITNPRKMENVKTGEEGILWGVYMCFEPGGGCFTQLGQKENGSLVIRIVQTQN